MGGSKTAAAYRVYRKHGMDTYSCMRFLCAAFSKKGMYRVDFLHLEDRMFVFKEMLPETEKYLFDDIEFRTGIDGNVFSDSIAFALYSLQSLGMIKYSSRKADILITPDEADEILAKCDKKTADMLDRLVDYVCV